MKDIFLFLLFPFAIIMIAFLKKRKGIIALYEKAQSNNFVGVIDNQPKVTSNKQDGVYASDELYSEPIEPTADAATEEYIEHDDGVDEKELDRLLNEPLDWEEAPKSVIESKTNDREVKEEVLKQDEKNGFLVILGIVIAGLLYLFSTPLKEKLHELLVYLGVS